MSNAEQRAIEAYPEFIGAGFGCSCDYNQPQRTGFINGYHQAEKDLDILSWVKEVSSMKELSRAKEEALKAYPPRSLAANYDTIARRDAFEYGYLKAEKDLELDWQDIAEILNVTDAIANDDSMEERLKTMSEEEYCQEVLKRFKEKNP